MIKGLPLAYVFSCLSYDFEGTEELFQVFPAEAEVVGKKESWPGWSAQREWQQLNRRRCGHKCILKEKD